MTDDTDDTVDKPDNVLSFEEFRAARTQNGDGALDDDELIHHAREKIAAWKSAGTPSLAAVQNLFNDSIRANASSMARDKIIEAIIAAFGTELGGKQAMASTWGKIIKDFEAECAQDARENVTQPELTPEEKAALRDPYGQRCVSSRKRLT